jgi:hypothetical protein
MRPVRRGVRALLVVAVLGAVRTGSAAAQRFLPDDPLPRDQDTADIPRPRSQDLSTVYDVIARSFFGRPSGRIGPAANVNTLGEVPDSSWFTNRMGARVLDLPELVRGPDRPVPPDLAGPVSVIAAKSGGITPGFTIRDSRGAVFFIKLDPSDWPNLSTAADVIGAKFFHAFGYNVPDNYVGYLRRDQLRVAPGTRVTLRGGHKREMTEADLDESLRRAARRADGAVRVVASRRLGGQPVGPFEYIGTRGDDANDVFPHEDRRELRGLRVFSAWLNHDDSRAINSLDMYVEEDGRHFVRHHLIDFSSSLGSGSNARKEISGQNPRAGNEYLLELGPGLRSAVTLGLWERPWRRARYRVFPETGRIEADFFSPADWRPEYPNPAFERMRAADAFWAGRIVSRFSDEAVRAIVHTGAFTDPEAERHLVDVLLRRRDKVVRWAFAQISPLAEFEVVGEGGASMLRFRHLGEEAGLGRATAYEYHWFAFDNATGARRALGEARSASRPEVELPAAEGDYKVVRIRMAGGLPAWGRAVDVYLRGRTVVGVEREE